MEAPVAADDRGAALAGEAVGFRGAGDAAVLAHESGDRIALTLRLGLGRLLADHLGADVAGDARMSAGVQGVPRGHRLHGLGGVVRRTPRAR